MSTLAQAHLHQPLELLPASLLSYRKVWQPLLHSLPTHAYLIVTKLDRQPQPASLFHLVQALKQQGESVYVLSVSDLGAERKEF
jgi:hypothetical protein